jgi:glutathione peroxidase
MKLYLLGLLAMASLATAGPALAGACPKILDASLPSLGSEPTSLCQFQGKVVLAVNTASRCGFTPQYDGLEKLYKRYKGRGLVVLGFPANDFGSQEPGTDKEIAKFCEVNYGVSFPMFAKTSVVGVSANPFFAALAEKSGKRPQWNFHKYLIDRSGNEVLSFDSRVAPDDPKLVAALERMLGADPR